MMIIAMMILVSVTTTALDATEPDSMETSWTEKLYRWYEIMRESQGLICILLGSCILLALILVVINLHLFSYRLQRQQYRFIARLNYLLDTRVVAPYSNGSSTSDNNKTARESRVEVIATV